MTDPNFWSWPGCLSVLAVFLAFFGVAAAITFALIGSIEGLLLVIAILLAAILFVLATGKRGGQ